MRIDVKGRNVPVNDELRRRVDKKFAKVARQVSDLAYMDVELSRAAQSSDQGLADRGGHAVPEGRHPARVRGID